MEPASLADLEVSRAYPALRIRVRHDEGPLVLRPTLPSDAETIATAIHASLPALRAFMPFAHVPQTARSQLDRLHGAAASYFAGHDMTMALFRERDGAMLCMVGLHARVPLNPAGLEVGYWAPTPHAGKGYTTFGVRAILVYAFDKLGCDRVQVIFDAANVGSRRVVEKCGFALEGELRNATAAATPEQLAGGFQATGRTPLYALVPDAFAALPWVGDMRARLVYVNQGGYDVA